MISKRHILFLVAICLLPALLTPSCSEDRSSTGYQVHPTGWMEPDNPEFHGQAAIAGKGQSCGDCHEFSRASSTDDGAVGVCGDCHAYPHPTISADPMRAHQPEIANLDWDLGECAKCHGSSFNGGSSGVSCRECHSSAGVASPTSCMICHWQPPAADEGLPYGFLSGAFGAHAVHVVDKGYACTECHAPVTDHTHADGPPAEVDFSHAEIATVGDVSPQYAPPLIPGSGNGGCGSVYCHGNSTVSWLGDPVSCGSCHDLPPDTPVHATENRCHLCHPTVDPTSNYSVPDSIRLLPDLEFLHVDGIATVIYE